MATCGAEGRRDQATAVAGVGHGIGKDDALKVGKNLVVDAGDSVTHQDRQRQHHDEEGRHDRHQGQGHHDRRLGKINVKASSDVVVKGSKVGIN